MYPQQKWQCAAGFLSKFSTLVFASLATLSPACTKGTASVRAFAVPSSLSSPPVSAAASEGGELGGAEACPLGMVLVEGEYCPEVEHTCLEWMDPPGTRYAKFRCARYQKPAACKASRVHKRFCIDVTERTEPASDLPRHFMSWSTSKELCEEDGGRLCTAAEWQFACEGEELRPYPYGWERDRTSCNVDIMDGLGRIGRLHDHRAPASAHPACLSPFGVRDMAGNMEEWVTEEKAPAGLREVMKGAWWLPGRHACRSFQVGHGARYGGAETGTRCCKDASRPVQEVALSSRSEQPALWHAQ